MATRKLIIAAMVVGFAILISGSILILVLAKSSKNDANSTSALLTPGTAASLGPLSVTLVSSAVSPVGASSGQPGVVITVDMALSATANATTVADPSAGWALVSPTASVVPRVSPSPETIAGVATCEHGALAPGDSRRCAVAFVGTSTPSAGRYTVLYGRGSQRASWLIDVQNS